MRKKQFSLLHLIAAAALTAAILLGAGAAAAHFLLDDGSRALLKTYTLIRERFVGEYDGEEVVDGALKGMIDALGDRWSHYLDADAYVQQQETRKNEYVGIGCSVSYEREEGWLITRVEPDGPADLGGLKAGEVITAIDGISLAGEERMKHADASRGEEGTRVELIVLGTDGKQRSVTLVRTRVVTDPVSSELLEGGVGYVRIEDFHDRSADEAIAAVEDLLEQGAVSLVFDVRDNPGGYVTELTKLLDRLMPEGPIFRSSTRDGKETVTESDGNWVDLPMAVLVNGESYSAAEFFAGALQESGQAAVVGEQTCGKGYSQQTFALPNGGAASISTAEYRTGNGTSFIGTGVVPDRAVALTEEEHAALLAQTLSHDRDPQLRAALELLAAGN